MALFDRLALGFYLLFAFAFVNLAVAFPLGVASLSTYFSPNGLTKNLIPAWSLFPLVWAGIIAVTLTRRRIDRPLLAMKTMIYWNRKWLLRCLLLSGMMILMARAVTSYKSQIPDLVPYWADPYFADMDYMLFGIDPWRITHAIFGQTGTLVIDRVYGLWFMVMMLTLGWFCFSRNPKIQLRGLLTSLLCWTVMSNFFATIFASVGPCYYQHFFKSDRFAPLMEKIRVINSEDALLSVRAMDYLLKSYGKDYFGTGISAMPSLHVAMAFVALFAICSYTKWRWLKVLAAIYATTIFVGSVHLGWHYAVDGIASIIAVSLFWWATGRFVDWLDAREQSQRAPAPALTPLPATS